LAAFSVSSVSSTCWPGPNQQFMPLSLKNRLSLLKYLIYKNYNTFLDVSIFVDKIFLQWFTGYITTNEGISWMEAQKWQLANKGLEKSQNNPEMMTLAYLLFVSYFMTAGIHTAMSIYSL
jgi:hypothetical protein